MYARRAAACGATERLVLNLHPRSSKISLEGTSGASSIWKPPSRRKSSMVSCVKCVRPSTATMRTGPPKSGCSRSSNDLPAKHKYIEIVGQFVPLTAKVKVEAKSATLS
eukprot:6475413-Amphidinium_carterae.1